jgi:hypothetical protein
MKRQLKELAEENEKLRRIAKDLQWMARRYANGRRTYAVGVCNDATKHLIEMGVEIKPDPVGDTIWAMDGDDFDPPF